EPDQREDEQQPERALRQQLRADGHVRGLEQCERACGVRDPDPRDAPAPDLVDQPGQAALHHIRASYGVPGETARISPPFDPTHAPNVCVPPGTPYLSPHLNTHRSRPAVGAAGARPPPRHGPGTESRHASHALASPHHAPAGRASRRRPSTNSAPATPRERRWAAPRGSGDEPRTGPGNPFPRPRPGPGPAPRRRAGGATTRAPGANTP